MGTYAVTGSASGMGAAVVTKLKDAGHQVITVDLRDADVVADLSTADGRTAAVSGVLERADGRLDGAVLAAGVGPMPGREELIAQVNYFGVVDLLQGWRPALAAAGTAHVVVFSSNSTTTVPAVPDGVIGSLLAGDTAGAVEAAKRMGESAPSMAYAGSKIAVTRWMRRAAVTAEWAGSGIRLNAIAPGAILTPLLEKQLSTPETAKAIESFPVPVGGFGDPAQIADWVLMMLGPSADFLCGALIFVDGGTDAYFRPDDWPAPLGAERAGEYMRKMKEFVPVKR